MKRNRWGAWVAAGLMLAGGGAARGQETARQSVGAEAQTDLMVTVYNNNYGLVREVRRVTLPAGEFELEFRDVAEKIDPTSVAFKSLDTPDQVGILEQNYRYDLLNPATLLEKYVGREITFTTIARSAGGIDTARSRTGTLLSTNGGRIVRFGDRIVIDPPGSISLAELPGDLVANPMLVWRLRNTNTAEQRIETSYLTNDLSWKADYVAVVNEDDTRLDWTGWVTLNNRSGATYRDASLKLVAGDVRRTRPQPRAVRARGGVEMMAMAAEPQFTEESFFEYHLYTLERRATIANNETKQMTLLEGAGVAIQKTYVLETGVPVYGAQRAAAQPRKVAVKLEFDNTAANHLGIALPMGRVRVYKADSDGAQQFIGEDAIDHTPRDEKIRLKMGEAFDVVADHVQTGFQQFGAGTTESTYRVQVRNRKDEAVTVRLIERIPGDWEITRETMRSTRPDAATAVYTLQVGARATGEVTFTVRVRLR